MCHPNVQLTDPLLNSYVDELAIFMLLDSETTYYE